MTIFFFFGGGGGGKNPLQRVYVNGNAGKIPKFWDASNL